MKKGHFKPRRDARFFHHVFCYDVDENTEEEDADGCFDLDAVYRGCDGGAGAGDVLLLNGAEEEGQDEKGMMKNAVPVFGIA